MAFRDGEPVVCVPMKLDAFVLNKSLCNSPPRSTLAPITQPNYTFLRLGHSATEQEFLIQPDLLDHTDLHAAGDFNTNSRISDLGHGTIRENRAGVYLSWILPRFYRQGAANAQDTSKPGISEAEKTRRNQQGNKGPTTNDTTQIPDLTAPVFRNIPNRWLIVRRLHLRTVKTPDPKNNSVLKEFQGWIIESDRLRDIDNLRATDTSGGKGKSSDQNVLDSKNNDIEVDMAPFVQGTMEDLKSQAEIFIGIKLDALGWHESTGPNVTRIPVSILDSSNPLFADFTLHNGNVLSMIDRFEESDGRRIITDATASYYVLGWHSNDRLDDDIFTIRITNPKDPDNPTRGSRFDGCNMKFPEGVFDTSKDLETWRNSSVSARTMCHAAMYNVKFSTEAIPKRSGAEVSASSLTRSIAIGTTPLDAVLTFIDSHMDDPALASSRPFFTDLKALQPLLLKQEEDVDSQSQAADMLSDHNFAPSLDSDNHWHISGQNSDGTPFSPQPDQLKALIKINNKQELLDQGARDLRQMRRDLWTRWWKYNSSPQDLSLDPAVKAEVNAMAQKISDLQSQLIKWKTDIDSDVASFGPNLKLEKGARDRFYSLRDPTMLIGNLPSPWPADFQDDLKVRLASRTVPFSTSPSNPFIGWLGYQDFVQNDKTGMLKVFPSGDLQVAGQALLAEFFMLHPPEDPTDIYKPPTTGFIPLYHDVDPGAAQRGSQELRDNWNDTQPWFPLFIEWECEYTHIPAENWAFEQVPGPNSTTQYRYGIRPGKKIFNETLEDVLTTSGRVLVLPQPSFSLANKVQQLWQTFSPEQQADIESQFDPTSLPSSSGPDSKAIDGLLMAIRNFPFMSSPMTGLTDNLTTQLHGTHLKPLRRIPGQSVKALPNALWENAGFNAKCVEMMETETDTVPYAWHIDFPADRKFSPLKPVTHGQLRFTKLNIIDKFGQAVSAIDPRYGKGAPLRLSVSQYYRPQQVDDPVKGSWNTVQSDPDPLPRFVQLPPNINQDARLNACLLTRDIPSNSLPNPPWRTALEWESPLWGWIIVNYVERGIQIFLPNGEFYREVRLGGVGGDTTDPKFKPFEPPTGVGKDVEPEFKLPMGQLDSLLQRLGDSQYLAGFIDMINDAMASLPYAPNEYADYLAAILGKPLALVNIGWSVELAVPPLANQSYSCPIDPTPAVTDYNFPLWIGDRDRVYDGLVGFFKASKAPPSKPGFGPENGQELDLTKLYTFFPRRGPTVDLAVEGPVVNLQPYHFSTTTDMDPTVLRSRHDAQFSVIGALMDPFTAVHGYSGILPIKPVTIPPWAVQKALKSMAAFFTIGPLIVPRTVDKFSPDLLLTTEMAAKELQKLTQPGAVSAGSGIPIPVPPASDWIWLQPFDQQVKDPKDKSVPTTLYNAVGVEVHDTRPKFEKPPYVAVEGFLQLRTKGAEDAATQ